MKFHWEPLLTTLDAIEYDLVVTDTTERLNNTSVGFTHQLDDGRWVCRFISLKDNEDPDGKTYKNLKDAKAFIKRMAPALVIARITS